MTRREETPLLVGVSAGSTINDAYRSTITRSCISGPDDALRCFFAVSPNWLRALMLLRNEIVGRLGFETGNKKRGRLPKRFEIGDRIGLFEVLRRSDEEIIFGGLDRHFSVQISMWVPREGNSLSMTTIAHHHTLIGRAYLAIVALPHRFLAPYMTSRTAQS